MDSRTNTSAGTTVVISTCKRVLVVDSSPSARAVTEARLLAESYIVTAVGSGIQALAILQEYADDFDFVLTEIHLYDINGFEFLDTLRKESNAIVFVLSAYHDEELVQKAFDKGAFMFYDKPIAKEYVDELWRNALIVKQRRQSLGKGKERAPINDIKEHFTGEWTSSLHGLFVEAVKEIGLRYADAKNIQAFMNVSGLTKKHISEHLQMYFRSLMKMEQEAMEKEENQDCVPSFKRVRRW